MTTRTPRPTPERPESKPRSRFSVGIVVFLGSLLGSLLGVAADFGDAAQTFANVQRSLYPQLCVAGSNTILGDGIPLAQAWQSAFQAREPYNVSIQGVGSVRGVEMAAEGQCVHVLAMSEAMTEAQTNLLTNAGIEIECAAEIGYDIIAFVTDIDNRVGTLMTQVVPSILNGSVINWREVGGADQNILIYARPASGTTDHVLTRLGGWIDPDQSDLQYFPSDRNYVPCDSNGDCLNQVLSTPGSLYWVSVAWMKTQPQEYLQVIKILPNDERGIDPLTDAQVDLDEYPSALIRPLYMYVLDSPSIADEQVAEARKFLEYVRSVEGQRTLESYNFFTFFDRPREVEVVLPRDFSAGADGRRPVCRA
jgi:phosphate transport system substrate-binding protein